MRGVIVLFVLALIAHPTALAGTLTTVSDDLKRDLRADPRAVTDEKSGARASFEKDREGCTLDWATETDASKDSTHYPLPVECVPSADAGASLDATVSPGTCFVAPDARASARVGDLARPVSAEPSPENGACAPLRSTYDAQMKAAEETWHLAGLHLFDRDAVQRHYEETGADEVALAPQSTAPIAMSRETYRAVAGTAEALGIEVVAAQQPVDAAAVPAERAEGTSGRLAGPSERDGRGIAPSREPAPGGSPAGSEASTVHAAQRAMAAPPGFWAGALPLAATIPFLIALAALAIAIAVLYSREAGRGLLKHDARSRIYETIATRPGLSCQQVANATGLGLVNTRYHLRRLESSGLVASREVRRRARYYIPGASVDFAAADAIAAPLAERIYAVAQGAPEISLAELARRSGAAPPLCLYHVKRLVAAGLLTPEGEGRQRVYRSNLSRPEEVQG